MYSATTTPRVARRTSGGKSSATYTLELFFVSLSALLLEISYTRIVSFKLFYYFTYFALGLALLGLGAGGVIVAISERVRRASTDAIMAVSLLAGAGMLAVGYLIVALARVNTSIIWDYGSRTLVNGLELLGLCLVLFVSFIPAGVILATVFSRRPEIIGRLYFADLAGAAVASAVAVPLMVWIGPPAAIMLAAVLLGLPGLRIARRLRPWSFWYALVALLVVAACVVRPGLLPDVRLDGGKAGPLSSGRLIYSSWSSLFRVDVRQVGDERDLFHDGLLGSVMLHWNGEQSSLAKFGFEHDTRSLPFAAAPASPTDELIIGAAAGHEVLASLYFKARHVDAVELNPVTYKLVTKTMADYDGHLAQRPDVHYVNADGRSYLARTHSKYDLIWYTAPDSYSATNASSASAFVLSESYLYTSNAIVDSLKHLAPDGVIATQFGEFSPRRPTRTARYVETVRAALRDRGVRDPASHILVSTTPGNSVFPELSTILVKATPFTAADILRFSTNVGSVPGSRVSYAPGHANPSEPITRFVDPASTQLGAAGHSSYAYSVGSISDDKPFFWHFTPFVSTLRDFSRPLGRSSYFAAVAGERVLLLELLLALVLSAMFLLLPFRAIRTTWRQLPRKRGSAVYFTAIGFGFIFFEITMIQKLVLFLGYPTYSLTVTLSSLLIFVGLGALLSANLRPRGRGLLLLPVPVAALTAFFVLGLTPMTDSLLHLPLAARIPIAFAVLAPLGLTLGLFMPLGVRRLAELTEFSREYVAWAWALNGFASVVGSVLATMLAMTYGFGIVLLCAFGAYVVATAALYNLAGAVPDHAV